MKYKRHPVSSLFETYDLKGDEFDSFAADIGQNGLRQTILLAQDKGEWKIADGWNRYRACDKAKVEPKFSKWDGQGSLVELVFGLNVLRRHLPVEARAMLAAAASHLADLEEEARQRMLAGTPAPADVRGSTASKLAKLAKVSKSAINRAQRVTKKGIPALGEAVRTSKIKLSPAARIAALPPSQQMKAMAKEAKRTRRRLEQEDARDAFDRWQKLCDKIERQMKQSGFVPDKVLDAWATFRDLLRRAGMKF
jgi:hypothetical protein